MDKKGTVLVIKAHSAYNVLRRATDEIAEGFIKNGYDVEMFDTTELDDLNYTEFIDVSIRILTDNEYTMIFSMQSIFSDVFIFDKPFIDFLKTPFVGYIVDDPMFHSKRLMPTSDNYHLCCIDKNHINFIKKYYKNISNVHLLYHGGFNYKGDIIPLKEREIDVFISGTYCNKQDLINSITKNTDENMTFVYDIIDILEKQQFPSVPKVIEEIITKENLDLTIDEMKNLFEGLVTTLDLYIRNYYRLVTIDALVESGVKVTVCGNGFSKYEGKNKDNITILSDTGIDIEETLKVMANSKIVLNTTATHTGSHERVYTTMNCGAVCVTNEIPDMVDVFKDNEDYILYDLLEISDLPNKVINILNNLDYAQKIADNGRMKSQNYKWENRALDIIKIFDDIKKEV